MIVLRRSGGIRSRARRRHSSDRQQHPSSGTGRSSGGTGADMVPHRRQIGHTNPLQDPAASRQIISAADMDAAAAVGTAAAFSQMITFIRRYQETWWLSTDVGWLAVCPPVAVVLDEHAEQMRQPARKSATN